MSSLTPDNLRIFISYSHDSDQHKDRVLSLSDRLRADGIDCIIDQYETSLPEGWARWCGKQVKKAEFVLIVCTKTYQLRLEGDEVDGKGKGAIWEGAIITQELYDSQGRNDKFIPVIFTPEDESHIPTILRGASFYNPNTEKGYEFLYRHLTNQPLTEKPLLGKLKSLPPRTRKHEVCAPCNVPFHRNPYFTGRENVFEKLREALKSEKTAALVQAISGLGGIGKTQTAVEYTYRYGSEYSAVLRVKTDSIEALISDYAALAHVIDLPEKATSLNNLAELYRTKGKFTEAESMCRRALAILKKGLGENHPSTIKISENLAALLRKTNREAEAHEMEERARGIRGGGKEN